MAAGGALEAAAGTSHHGRTPKDAGLSPAQDASIEPRQATTGAARRALLPRDSERSGACLRLLRTRQPAACWQLARRTAAARRTRQTCRRCSALPLGLITTPSVARCARGINLRAEPLLKRQRAQWRTPALDSHAVAGCALAAGTSHHGRSPKETVIPPVQRPSLGYKPTSASAAWRVRDRPSCCTSCPKTASAVALPFVPHASRLCVEGRRWHVAPRPHAEGGRPFADATPLNSA